VHSFCVPQFNTLTMLVFAQYYMDKLLFSVKKTIVVYLLIEYVLAVLRSYRGC
jgi:hypothetical protein